VPNPPLRYPTQAEIDAAIPEAHPSHRWNPFATHLQTLLAGGRPDRHPPQVHGMGVAPAVFKPWEVPPQPPAPAGRAEWQSRRAAGGTPYEEPAALEMERQKWLAARGRGHGADWVGLANTGSVPAPATPARPLNPDLDMGRRIAAMSEGGAVPTFAQQSPAAASNPYATHLQTSLGGKPSTAGAPAAPTTVAGAAASASRTLSSRRKGGAGGKGKVAVAGPAAHKASPSWREHIMQAASHGDVYMRKMHDVLIRARRSAAANRGQGLAPFVPVRDYKHNKMILVVDDGTDFVFDMNSRKGQAEYKKALAQAGYSGQKLSKYADAASSELAHIATYGESEEQTKAARLEAEQSMQAGVANINDEADLKTMMAQLAEVN